MGTVKGSIFGLILYALLESALLNLSKITLFVDDNFILGWNRHKAVLVDTIRIKLEMITKWLRESGLK